MVANAKMTPEETLNDLLGQHIGDDAPKAMVQPVEKKPKAVAKKPAPAPVAQQTHKLSIMLTHEDYLAMQMYKSVRGPATGERSLQDIGLNAIRCYTSAYSNAARSCFS